jgi:hypothetical protein
MSTLCVGVTVGAKASPWELVEVLQYFTPGIFP